MEKRNMLRSQVRNMPLELFVERLEKEWYDTIKELCQTANKQAFRLKELEIGATTSQYVVLCLKLIDEIEDYIKFRKEQLVPYVHRLGEKDNAGHDCSTCTGKCKLQHDLQLAEMEDSLHKMKDTLSRLQMAVLPLYSETLYPDAYRVLRNQMALLESSLTEIYSFEEIYLVPKIIEAQKNIHALS